MYDQVISLDQEARGSLAFQGRGSSPHDWLDYIFQLYAVYMYIYESHGLPTCRINLPVLLFVHLINFLPHFIDVLGDVA